MTRPRFIYAEVSSEDPDQHNEIVAQQALRDSADFFLKFGNCDIDHITLTGRRQGIADAHLHEVGVPIDVKFEGKRTFVKAEIFRGDGPAAARANALWASLTEIQPPSRWYASVGGQVLEKAEEIGPGGGRVTRITKTRWSNLALTRTPVHSGLPTVSLRPIGPFLRN